MWVRAGVMPARIVPMVKVVIEKPPYGDPCNGCGYCCEEAVCAIGMVAGGPDTVAPCPFLLQQDGRNWCRLVLAEQFLNQQGLCEPVFAKALGIGRGCDATKPDEVILLPAPA